MVLCSFYRYGFCPQLDKCLHELNMAIESLFFSLVHSYVISHPDLLTLGLHGSILRNIGKCRFVKTKATFRVLIISVAHNMKVFFVFSSLEHRKLLSIYIHSRHIEYLGKAVSADMMWRYSGIFVGNRMLGASRHLTPHASTS